MDTLKHLGDHLRAIDGRPYGAYKDMVGVWRGADVDVCLDYVQGDPFAAPSVVRLVLHNAGYAAADLAAGPHRTATCDLVLRRFAQAAQGADSMGSGKSGRIQADAGGAEMLPRAACEVNARGELELRLRVGLPANGRRIRGRDAAQLLARDLPQYAAGVHASKLAPGLLQSWQRSAVEHRELSRQVAERGLVAFVADGAVLPRMSGVSYKPMKDAVPFESPHSLRVELSGVDGAPITGMGIPRGITIITGPGFHGKSTLLQALQTGIYPHVPGDGRERVVTDASAVKVRSEDGRSVNGVNVRPFIKGPLPGGKSTVSFSTEDASGSTSLAAAIQESLEAGANTLLLDEDTCATNLLVCDARMQELVKVDAIVPLVDRATQMKTDLGLSIIAVIGGCGDYLDVADITLAMREYRAFNVTREAKSLVQSMPSGRSAVPQLEAWDRPQRTVDPRSLASTVPRRGSGKARGLRDLIYGHEELSLDGLEQLVDPSQVRFIGVLLEWMGKQRNAAPLYSLAERAVQEAEKRGCYGMKQTPELALVRPMDLVAVINRLRNVRLA